MGYVSICTTNGRIYHKFINEDGERKVENVAFKPQVFVPYEHGTFRSYVTNIPLQAKKFENCYEFFAYKKQNKYSEEKYGWIDPEYQFLYQTYKAGGFKTLDTTVTTKNLRYLFIDLEVLIEDGGEIGVLENDSCYPISTIAAYDSYYNQRFVFGYKDYTGDGDFRYVKADDELDMLKKFMHLWKSADYPDMVIGWNSHQFDIPYLCNRLAKLDQRLYRELSPIQYVSSKVIKDKDMFNKEFLIFDIAGVQCVDLMSVYKKFETDPIVSYSLDVVSEKELKQNKLDYEGSLLKLYENDFNRYCDYNMIDVDLVVAINKKKKLLELVVEVSYNCMIMFNQVTLPTAQWNYKTTFECLLPNKIVPNLFNSNHLRSFKGGDVKETIPGLHKWVQSIDVGGMYPNGGIRSQNAGPETILDGPGENAVRSPSGHYFSKDTTSYFSQMITKLVDERSRYKKEMKQKEKRLEELLLKKKQLTET